ncbi:hypothetical protein ABEX25_23565 [Paenibacillus thiaminolyticus]|uniref:hypothetical protein n=1 Tax=Paenibacillus thiaminolyticus TaxID=49283 RepID=UPI003D2A21EA
MAVGTVYTTPETGWKRYEEADRNITYIGSWTSNTTISTADWSGGWMKQTSSVGDEARFNFLGTSIRIICKLLNTRSNDISIIIDGIESRFSEYHATLSAPYVSVFEIDSLKNGEHSVIIRANDTKFTVIDAIDISEKGYMLPFNKEITSSKKVLFQSKIGEALSIINRNATPQMTSYKTPSGKVEDSGSILTWEGVTYSGWNLFNKLNHWVTANTTTGWVSYEFETPKKIIQYILTAPSLDANLNRMAKDWEIQAFDVQSNSWVVLDKQSSQTGWKALEKRKYKLNNHNSYKKYKLNVTANNGAASNLQVFRLELLAQNSIDCITKDEISSSDFDKYGMTPHVIATHIKNSFSKKRLITAKSKVFETGKTFEHEIDLKKYEVNEVVLQ